MDDIAKVLHSPFDIETHKATFANYLEVVIAPDGTIEYAVPSHNDKLEKVYMEEHGITVHEEVWNQAPAIGYLDWLIDQTGYVSVWNDYLKGRPNKNQRHALRRLKMAGLYKGHVPRFPSDDKYQFNAGGVILSSNNGYELLDGLREIG